MDRVRIVVSGRVQGVGYRAFVLREARARDLSGSVWNRGDGAVELEAEGDRVQLRQLVERLREGPAGARVTDLSVTWDEGPSRHDGFTISSSRAR